MNKRLAQQKSLTLYRFYRFRSDGEFADNAQERQIFEKNQVFFSSRSRFNDPFEVAPRLLPESPADDDVQAHFKRLVNIGARDRSLRERRQIVADWMSDHRADPAKYLQLNAKLIRDTERKCSVLCLSRSYKHPLMWSQYADRHTGYCVAFRFTELIQDQWIPEPVNYCSERPRIPLGRDLGRPDEALRLAQDLFLPKAPFWRYEREWRIVRTLPEGLQVLDGAKPIALYLGARIDPRDQEKILELNAGSTFGVARVYKASLSEDKFALQFSPINSSAAR